MADRNSAVAVNAAVSPNTARVVLVMTIETIEVLPAGTIDTIDVPQTETIVTIDVPLLKTLGPRDTAKIGNNTGLVTAGVSQRRLSNITSCSISSRTQTR